MQGQPNAPQGLRRGPTLAFRYSSDDGSFLNGLGTYNGSEQIFRTGRTQIVHVNARPFGRNAVLATYGNNLYVGTQDEYEIRVVNNLDTLDTIVRLQRENAPVTPEILDAYKNARLANVHARERAAREAKRLGGNRWMDICSGTGELARNMAAQAASAGDKLELHVVDGSLPMILLAKNKKQMHKVKFTLADAGHLPFPDKSFDLIAISFATRNLNPNPETLLLYLKEFFRVLKPKGNFLNLETSQPPLGIIRRLYHLYIRLIVRPVGYIISGIKNSSDVKVGDTITRIWA